MSAPIERFPGAHDGWARFDGPGGTLMVDSAVEAVFAPLLEGLLGMAHVRVIGPTGVAGRTPTVLFSVEGEAPDAVAAALAHERIAAWSGDNYAFETARALGIAATGVGVRLGIARYTTSDDVERVLQAVDALR